jgi:predicted phage terminase large subunit-like protein
MPLGVYKIACWVNERGAVPSTPDDTTVPTFPERFSIPRLLALRAEMGSEVFAAQMLLNPEDQSTAVFARAKILPYIKSRPAVLKDTGGLDKLWIAMTVDPAISTKAWADYTAMAVGGFDRDGVLWILDLRRGRWQEDRTLFELYDAWEKTPGIKAIGFEAVGFQQIYRRLIVQEGERRGYHLPITRLERDTRQKKNIRIRALQPHWENGNIRIVDDAPALEDFLEEASRFRTYRESDHDDLLDAVVDLFQLRLRPAAAEPEYLTGDPELDARMSFEVALAARRRELGAPALDRGALRVAYDIHRVSTTPAVAETVGMAGDFWR